MRTIHTGRSGCSFQPETLSGAIPPFFGTISPNPNIISSTLDLLPLPTPFYFARHAGDLVRFMKAKTRYRSS